MNAVSQLIRNRRKLVRDVGCLAAEGRLFQRTAPLVSLRGLKPKMTAARVVSIPLRVLSCLNRIMTYYNAFQNL